MKRFEPTEALNRVIDRSDEMAWGFTFQLLHPFSFFSLSSPSITDSSTAEFHLYVNEMEENRPAISQQPAAFPSLTTSTIRAEYRHHRNVNASHCRRVEKVRSLKRHPTPLTPELRASGLKQPPHHCALWWHSPVYLLQGKMGNTCRIGRDVLRGGMGGAQNAAQWQKARNVWPSLSSLVQIPPVFFLYGQKLPDWYLNPLQAQRSGKTLWPNLPLLRTGFFQSDAELYGSWNLKSERYVMELFHTLWPVKSIPLCDMDWFKVRCGDVGKPFHLTTKCKVKGCMKVFPLGLWLAVPSKKRPQPVKLHWFAVFHSTSQNMSWCTWTFGLVERATWSTVFQLFFLIQAHSWVSRKLLLWSSCFRWAVVQHLSCIKPLVESTVIKVWYKLDQWKKSKRTSNRNLESNKPKPG